MSVSVSVSVSVGVGLAHEAGPMQRERSTEARAGLNQGALGSVIVDQAHRMAATAAISTASVSER